MGNPQLHHAPILFLTECNTDEVGSLHTPQPNTFKLRFSQSLTFNPSKQFPVLGQLESPLYFKNV
jgi:hypothetical protein